MVSGSTAKVVNSGPHGPHRCQLDPIVNDNACRISWPLPSASLVIGGIGKRQWNCGNSEIPRLDGQGGR